MKVPSYSVGSLNDYHDVTNDLGVVASKGILVHVPSELYKDMVYSYGRSKARSMISPSTAHNDKLGFDWRVNEGRYAAQIGNHYKTSSYAGQDGKPGLLHLAANFHRMENPTYAAHLLRAAKVFNLPTIKKRDAPPIDGDARYAPSGKREVNGLDNEVRDVLGRCQREINGLEQTIAVRERELQDMKRQMDIDRRSLVPTSDVREALLSVPRALAFLHESITAGPELVYA
jgi:hypothetical protein